MIRAIRFHCEKIKKCSNLIAAYRRREEYKSNVWDTEEKRLKYVDAQAENLEIPFTSTTYSPGFLAFLVHRLLHASQNVTAFMCSTHDN